VSDAAAATHFGKFGLALEWLEQSRSIVWGQMLQLRTPLENLRQRHPYEADELEKISRALESAATVERPNHSSSSDVGTSQTHPPPSRLQRVLATKEIRVFVQRCRLWASGNRKCPYIPL
jgi:hypothetical protein